MQINHNIILLPTDKASNIVQHKDGKLFFFSTGAIKLTENHQQHLCFIDDSEIKEGDWFILKDGDYKGELRQAVTTTKGRKELKIIATSDKSLTIKVSNLKSTSFDNGCELFLPQIPQDFIKYFVEKQGNVGKVMVEYEEIDINSYSPTWEEDYAKYGIKHKENLIKRPKLTKDNEVIISLEEKSYTRDEVKDLLVKYGFHLTGNMQLADALWIEQNL